MLDLNAAIDHGQLRRQVFEEICPVEAEGVERLMCELKAEQIASYFEPDEYLHTLDELIQWLDELKARNHMFVKREGLNELGDWGYDAQGFFAHKSGRFFRFIGMRVRTTAREVAAWSQPIMDNIDTGVIGLLLKRHKGTTYFLMQAKADVGNRSLCQLGPTVRFTPGNYEGNERLALPYLYREFMQDKFMVLWQNRQSEEGGRFYREEHMHKIMMLPEGVDIAPPEDFRWMSFNQLRFFLSMGEYVTSNARSILACLV